MPGRCGGCSNGSTRCLWRACLRWRWQGCDPWRKIICGSFQSRSVAAKTCFDQFWVRWVVLRIPQAASRPVLRPSELTLPLRSMRVFESVINADRLIHALLVGTDVTPNLRESSSALLAGLPKIQEDIRAVESQLAGLVSASNQSGLHRIEYFSLSLPVDSARKHTAKFSDF